VNGGGGDLRWDRQWRRLGYSFVLVFSFRGAHLGALQDLYEDWSAIYRNRIPLYLTLPLARSSQPPLYLTDHSAPLLILFPFPFRSFALLLAGFIQSFAALTLLFSPFLSFFV